MCAGGVSDADVARVLNEEGYRPNGRGDRALPLFSKDTLSEILQNRFYVGEVQYRGQWLEGLHEPVIPEELFTQCQVVRSGRRGKPGISGRKDRGVHPLTGLARCARCGGRMRATRMRNRRYYRDLAREHGRECDQRMVPAESAEAALGDFLRQLSLPGDWQSTVLRLIGEQAGPVRDVEQEKERIQGQLQRLGRLFVLGDIREQKYLADRASLRDRLAALVPPGLPDLERAAALLHDFGAIWDAAPLAERKQICHSLPETVYLDRYRGPVVAIKPRAEFAQLFDLAVEAGSGSTQEEDQKRVGREGIALLAPGTDWRASDPGRP